MTLANPPARRPRQPWWWRVLMPSLWLLALLHAGGVARVPGMATLDTALSDAVVAHGLPARSPQEAGSSPVVIVDVDERSLRQVGHWPWPREVLAGLVAQTAQSGAKVVGLDMVFPEQEVGEARLGLERLAEERPDLRAWLKAQGPGLWRGLDGDQLLADVMQGAPVCAGYLFESGERAQKVGVPGPPWPGLPADASAWPEWPGFTANLGLLAQAAPCGGAFNAEVDADGVLRRVPMLYRHGGQVFPALSLAMVRMGTGHDPLPRSASESDPPASLRLAFRGEGGRQAAQVPYYSAVDVLQGRVGATELSGRYVLVGTTASGLHDLRATPVQPLFPGVEVHALAIRQLLEGRMPSETPRAWQWGLIVLLAALSLALMPRLSPLASMACVLGGAGSLVLLEWLAWRSALLAWPVGGVLGAWLLGAGLQWLWGYWWEGRQRRALKALFGAYVSPERVEEMAQDPERYDMEARNEVLTVMFCDLRNFTGLSETLAPQELRELINLFLSRMSEEITAHGGTIDKFIGDAVMAFWGAPVPMTAHAAAASRCALAMSRAVKALNAQLHADPRWKNHDLPEIGMGVGLHTGLMCVGDMGARHRLAYTVLGDAVNLAARVEGLTRFYGVDVLATQDTVGAAGQTLEAGHAPPLAVWIDRVRVKGKTQAVELQALFEPGAEIRPVAEEMREWEAVLRAYHHKNWEGGRLQLERLAANWPASPLQTLYQLYALRFQRFSQHPPPEDWDGCHDHFSK